MYKIVGSNANIGISACCSLYDGEKRNSSFHAEKNKKNKLSVNMLVIISKPMYIA